MQFSIRTIISTLLLTLLPSAFAISELTSSSLSTCQDNSKFSATLFEVSLIPGNGTLGFDINGVSTITGKVTLDIIVYAYGLKVYSQTLNPCASDSLAGLCPMQEGQLTLAVQNIPIPGDALSAVPGITYTVPNLDASFQILFNSSSTGEGLACVQASLSNGKTVNQPGVAWALAICSGLALVSSAITSGLGHSNTAAHVAGNALSLFAYFQAQAFIGMTAVDLPPIVSAWTQNFQWSMGIIHVGFLQDMATWYQRSTGGTPSLILSNLGQYSVQVQKRSLPLIQSGLEYGRQRLVSRASNSDTKGSSSNPIIVRGIERVGFVAGIEPTNIFFTGYIFFIVFVVIVVLGVVIFKYVCEALAKAGKMDNSKFGEFRSGWTTVLKGIMYRIVLIGFPQMVVLCFWELTRDDSGAEMVLAILTIATMIGILGWAASKVVRLARRSIAMHKNPAYILYSDPISLNKWGFLYVQFRAAAYYFTIPVLAYIFIRGCIIAFGQWSSTAGIAQAIALLLVEAIWLIVICVMKPHMDKKTNAFNISICVVSLVNAIFLVMFSDVFGQPGIVSGVMGVIFFVYNAVFSTVLLILVLIAAYRAVASKNPDTRYQPMPDDRSSFIKSHTQLTELDALGATARGESRHGYTTKAGSRVEIDDDSFSGDDTRRQQAYGDAPSSLFPSPDLGNRHMPPADMIQQQRLPPPRQPMPMQSQHQQYEQRLPPPRQPMPPSQPSQQQLLPQQQHRYAAPAYSRSQSSNSGTSRQQNNASPWQRGAGYD